MTPAPLLALLLAAAPVLTLDEAVETARARRPSLGAARGLAEAAEASAREARGPLLPQLDLAGRYTLSREDPPGRGNAATSDTLSGSLSADQLLWDFGRTSNRWRSARASADAAEKDADAAARDVVLEVRLAYFGLLEATALEGVARDTLANQERHLAQTAEMVKAGTRAAIDLARLRTAVASARAALVRAGNATRLAKARLDVAMGLPARAEYQAVAPSLPALAAEAWTGEALFGEAARARPELASGRAAVAAQEHTVGAVERALWPSLRLGAGADASGPWDGGFDPAVGTSVGLILSWPIFDGLSSPAAADAARARLSVERARLADREQGIWEEVEDAAAGVASARAELPAAEEALGAARDLLGLAEARYREGVGTSLELADAQLELASAAAERVRVEYDLAGARAQLLRALGKERWE
jgi:outer membrane protein